ncbi:MAG: glycosyl hydrolase family 39, partial [Terriglobales bacterium]
MIKRIIRRECNVLLPVLSAILVFTSGAGAQASAKPSDVLVIDASAPAHPFPHFWEHMFGSGRANLTLRESYRNDLRQVKQITDLEYVRFHAIFLDDMGVYDEDSAGHPIYNFSYVDQAYDGLLQNCVRPFVELSFMPRKLAAKDAPHAFWYKQNVAPPKDWAKWDDLIYQFTKHLA